MTGETKDLWKRDLLAGIKSPVAQTWDSEPASSPVLNANTTARSVLDTIRGVQPVRHTRVWEKHNRAFSYDIPAPLHSTAAQLRDDLLSISQFDPEGRARENPPTVSQVAAILMDWALHAVQNNPGLLNPQPNRHSSKGQMTVVLETWDSWDATPIALKPPLRQKKNAKPAKDCVLSFRWSQQIDQHLKELAGREAGCQGSNKQNKYAIPLGELVVCLLQIAVNGYLNRKFVLRIGFSSVASVDGWSNE